MSISVDPPTARTLDAETREALVAAVADAKRRGWLQPDLRRYFKARGIEFATYAAAKTGQAVDADAASVFTQMSITGLPGMPHQPNPDDIKRHIEWLVAPARGRFDDALLEIAFDGEGRGPSSARLFGLDEIEDAVAFAVSKNIEWRNVYLGAALRAPDTERTKRSTGDDFYVATAVPIDIDHDYDATRAKMAAVCDDGLVVTTGLTPERRSQHWARLIEPCDDDLAFEHAFGALVSHTGADMKVKDKARIMRLGGTVSFPKDAKKLAAGYCTELTTVTLNERARPADVDALKALEPGAATAPRFDLSGRPQGSGIERRGIAGSGAVFNGREEHFRNLLLKHIRTFQEANGADPEADDLWAAAFAEFSDPEKVDNCDGRWTCADGRAELRNRLHNTLRRLRAGHLARRGLYSIDTGVGREIAEEVQATRPFVAVKAVAEAEVAPVAGSSAAAESGVDGQPVFDPWERYVVPRFPLDTLPPVLRKFVAYQADSVGVDPAAAAMAALAACSGAIDQRTTLKMKRTGDWCVRPRLWVMLVGDPSSKKTPIISACIRPLRSEEGKHVAAYQRELARWKGMDKDERGDEPPRPVRYIFNDITTEKVGDVLSRQDRGALVEHDELSGWIGSMDKYSGGKGSSADRSFWAQAYNGGPKTIDRLQRGEIYIQNLCVAFLAGMQPDRLSEVANLTSDGLLQRFVPVMMRRAAFPTEVESDLPAKHYEDLVGYLTSMSPQGYAMDEGGRQAADEFQRFIFDLEGMEGLGKSFCTFAGKLTGLHGSLALLLHLVEDPHNAPFEPVSERTVRAADRILRDFILPHALEFYRSTTDGADWSALQAIASFVLTTSKARLTASDFTSNVRALRGLGTWDLAQKLSPLVAGGWLFEIAINGAVKAWETPPGLREAMSERREIELKSKAELMKKFKTLKEGAADE